jgi:hypothetical protein
MTRRTSSASPCAPGAHARLSDTRLEARAGQTDPPEDDPAFPLSCAAHDRTHGVNQPRRNETNPHATPDDAARSSPPKPDLRASWDRDQHRGGRRSWLDESRARSLIRRSGGWNELKGVVGRGAEHSAEMELTSGAGGPHVGLIACE